MFGFANYTRLFTQDSNFWTLFRNSVFWVLGSTVLQYFFAIPISVLLNQKNAGAGPLARADDGPLGHPYGNRRINMALDV